MSSSRTPGGGAGEAGQRGDGRVFGFPELKPNRGARGREGARYCTSMAELRPSGHWLRSQIHPQAGRGQQVIGLVDQSAVRRRRRREAAVASDRSPPSSSCRRARSRRPSRRSRRGRPRGWRRRSTCRSAPAAGSCDMGRAAARAQRPPARSPRRGRSRRPGTRRPEHDVMGDRRAEVRSTNAPPTRSKPATALTSLSGPTRAGCRSGRQAGAELRPTSRLVAEVALGRLDPLRAQRGTVARRSRPRGPRTLSPRSASRQRSAAPSSSAVDLRTVAKRQCSTSSSPS